MPPSIHHPESRRSGPPAKSFRSPDSTPDPRLEEILRHPFDPNRLQPLLPPTPCPHNRRRSDRPQPAPEPTTAPLHLAWHTVKQTVSHVLGVS